LKPFFYTADEDKNPHWLDMVPTFPKLPAFSEGSNRLLQFHGLFWRSLESGDLPHKARQSKKTM